MIRDPDRLTRRTFDLLVVGGGIYGLTIACDAAARGLVVALVEAGDFGSGSSFNHLRTIHGGLRYLQSLDIARARESIRERRVFAQIAPHAVRPLEFVLPLHRSFLRGPLAVRAGLLLDRIVAYDRNDDLPEPLRLPPGRLISRSEAITLCPELQATDIVAAAVWQDYVTIEPDRLTLAWAIAADAHGATLANYVAAESLLVEGKKVRGVKARDLESGRELEVAASLTVNATGGQLDRLLDRNGLATGMLRLKALNLVTRRPASARAVAGRATSGRSFFCVPWMNRSVYGTWESPSAAADPLPTESEVATFIGELRQAYPGLALNRSDVTFVHRGLVPAVPRGSGVALEGHERFCDHEARNAVAGLMSIAGAKYTTARGVAARIVDQVLVRLNLAPSPSSTHVTPLPGAEAAASAWRSETQKIEAALPDAVRTHLHAGYGFRRTEVLELALANPAWARCLDDDSPVIGAELVHAVRSEMAVRLTDAVLRRTPLGSVGPPSREAVEAALAIVGDELKWSAEKRDQERTALSAAYDLAG